MNPLFAAIILATAVTLAWASSVLACSQPLKPGVNITTNRDGTKGVKVVGPTRPMPNPRRTRR